MLKFKELEPGKWLSTFDRLLQVKGNAFKLTDSQYKSMTFIQQSQVIDFFLMMARKTRSSYRFDRYMSRVTRYRRLMR